MIKIPDEKGSILTLKILVLLALLVSNGSTFQSFVAAQVKERSPRVGLDFKLG